MGTPAAAKSRPTDSERSTSVETKVTATSLFKLVLFLAGIFVMLLGMHAMVDILAPVLLALLLALCLTPLMYWLMNKGAPGWLALMVTIVLDIVITVGLVWLIGWSMRDFASTITQYEQRFAEIEQALGGLVADLGIDPETLASEEGGATRGLLELAGGFVASLAGGLSNWGLVLITGFYLLVEATTVRRKVSNVTSKSDPDVRQIMSLAAGLRQYMVINAGVGVLAAVLNVILLAVVGVEFALVWGVLSFFLSFVPNIGFIISVIPPAIMALLQFGAPQMLIVVVAFIVINGLVDNVIKPQFIKEGVNIAPSVTFLSLVLWGWVLGPIGAILAVPAAIVIQAILNGQESTRWLAYMMGSGEEPFKEEAEGAPEAEGGELAPEAGG
jgi:predicted PurR-regulated permease PerM